MLMVHTHLSPSAVVTQAWSADLGLPTPWL